MSDHEPRYVYREMYGTTVGAPRHSWTFLILDSRYCYDVVLQVTSRRGNGNSATVLRRLVAEHLDALNDPPMCGCGCGTALPIRFPMRPRGGPTQLYHSVAHRDHHYHVLEMTA